MMIAYTVRPTEQSPTRLKFKAGIPTWFVAALWACLLGVGALLTATPTVECSWAPDGSLNCRIDRTLLGMTISTRTISGATAIGSGRLLLGEPGAGLIIQKGNTSIDVGGGGLSKRHDQALEALRRFIQEHRLGATWTISLPCQPLLWGFYVLFCLALFVASRPTLLCVDKEADKLEVLQPGIGKSRRRTLRLSDVVGFTLSQRYREFAEDSPCWAEKHFPNLLRARCQTSDETVLVLVARLKNGKEAGLLTNVLGGQRGLAIVRDLERFHQTPLAPAKQGARKPCAICGGECDGAPHIPEPQFEPNRTLQP